MYYEEMVIDGVLHWRDSPDGKWTPKTAAQLTEMLLEARRNSPATSLALQPTWPQPFVVLPQPQWVSDPLSKPPNEATR